MDDEDSDVQFEDEWEEVQGPELPAAAAAAAAAAGGLGDITIRLVDDDDTYADGQAAAGKRKRPAGRVYTKREREDAVAVHRAHCLCLLGNALLHDQAAADSELQGLLVSLLPLDLLETASAAATSEDPLARSWLPKLLHWFHNTFTATLQPLYQQQQQQAGGNSSRRDDAFLQEFLGLSCASVQQQLLACVAARSGSSSQLSVLLVALLRGVGFLTRSVWSLDALPFKPTALDALARGKSIRATTPAAAGAGRPPAAAAARSSRSKASSTAAATAAAAACGEDEAAAGGSSGRKRGRGGGRGSSRGRGSKATSGRGSKGKQQQTPSVTAAAAAGTDADADAGGSGSRKRRKGDEEFERELAMAMEATAAAEAASKKAGTMAGTGSGASPAGSLSAAAAAVAAAAAAGGGAGPSLSAAGSKRGQKQTSAELIAKGASPAELKRAAAAAAAAVPAGSLWQPRPGGLEAPKVWAEVYVGCSADGRWLHVDGQLGCYDQPSVVEAAVVRRQPLSYVVACQEGAPKDVTRRYAANFTVNLKWRDEAWWSATMAALRSSAAHLPRQLAAQVTDAAAEAAEAAAAIAAVAAVTVAPAAAAAVATDVAAKARARAGKRKQQGQAEVTAAAAVAAAAAEEPGSSVQQQQRKRRKQPPASTKASTKAAPSSSSDDEEVIITADKAAPAAAAAGGDTGMSGTHLSHLSNPHSIESADGGGSSSGAALRAAREDAELAARAAQQAAGTPTTVEGFKGHPLYVLQRHITKYQAVRPGAVKQGLHKGEAYFSRADVQDLHTRERWEREGRQVRPDELDKPAKEVKKRAVPAGGGSFGGRGGGFGRGRGGWGAWQRSSSANSARSGSADPPAAAAGEAGAAASTAAAAASGAGGTQEEAAEGDSSMQQLYGLWQTDEFVRRAQDGKVPRNERGNVEVPPLAKTMPLGTKWIDAANVAPICRSLGVDYAPALVGFEVQAGRMVPRIRGVVVCEEHEQAVIELHIKREAERAAVEQEKQRREAAAAWRRLLQHMWTRLELQRKYGDATDDGTAAAAAAGGGDGQAEGGTGCGAGGPGVGVSGRKGLGKLREVLSEMNAATGGDSLLQQAAAAAAAGAGSADAADAAARMGQQAARTGGGKAAARRGLPPSVVSARPQPGAQGGNSVAAQAAAGAAGYQQEEYGSRDASEQQQQAAAEGVADRHHDLQGVEVEEF